MAKKKSDPFIDLSWDDLRNGFGGKIVSRGQSYQQDERVSDLAVLEAGGLIAWVEGTRQYATQVTLDKDGLPTSTCTCPYGYDCKHGVAVVLEYLEQIQKNRCVPKVDKNDERLELLDKEGWDEEYLESEAEEYDESPRKGKRQSEIQTDLKGKTREQLADLVRGLADKFPQVAQELADRKEMASGNIRSLINRLKKEIHEISQEPGWQNHWRDEGYLPDYSEIRIKLKSLLEAGYADEVVSLGKDLIERGNRQVEESHDDGQTATEIEECMPILVKALEQSSMEEVDKLAWAVDVALKDDYDIFNAFGDYLCRRHHPSDWNLLADRLIKRLGNPKKSNDRDASFRNHARDHLSNWIVHALERAGRQEEIIPLCQAEATRTESYSRLVKYLISAKRFTEADQWIQKGIQATEKSLPGVASDLRRQLQEIRIAQKDWSAVAVMQAEAFVRYPSQKTFLECQKASEKTKTWPQVREHLLVYLEKGQLPWKQKGWPLHQPDSSVAENPYPKQFPMRSVLIEIAILEKQPDQVLFWYDQIEAKKQGWSGVDDEVADAIQNYDPQRAISIWKRRAESYIQQANPGAYEQAAGYLKKAEKLHSTPDQKAEWRHYIDSLKTVHARKRRLIELLDRSGSRPIIHIARKHNG
jgi:uncharacterized Zn finger protein